jgi:signal transduction histidine kinase
MTVPKAVKTDQVGLTEFLPVSLVVMVGILISIVVFVMTRNYYIATDRQQFQRDAAFYSANLKSDVERHVTSLAAIHAFVSASHDVSRWEFSAFANQILPKNSGFKSVLWLPQVLQKQRSAFETDLQRDGLYGLRLREITPAGHLINADTRPSYLPVAYVEPFEGSGNLIGVDLLNNPIYAQLFREAKKSGRQVASSPVSQSLVEGATPPIVIVVFPLNRVKYARGRAAPEGPEGYVLGVLQLKAVVEDAIELRAPVQAAIAYTQPGKADAFLLGQQKGHNSLEGWLGSGEFHQQIPFAVAGQHFLLALRSARHGGLLTRLYAPMGAALIILALTALLAQSMIAAILRRWQVERAVVERTVELRAANEALSEEIEHRKQAEAELRVARNKAEAANRAKSAFLSTMSHELRTPLNAIIGFSEILVRTFPAQHGNSEEYLQEINGSGIRLLDLINDILEITLMDTEADRPGDLVFVPDIISDVISIARAGADAMGVTLTSSIGDRLPLLHGNAKRIQKAILNLVSNAVKFSEKGGHALVAANMEAGCLKVAVSDNGVGMPAGSEELVKGIFSQYDTSLARKHEGVGLGLAFVSRVANLHDATLQITSRQGEGTTVTLIFPVQRIVQAREVA